MNPIEAVRALRQYLGESQQAFAARLGLSIRAVANYEKDREPNTPALKRLIYAAHVCGREDLADVFRGAYWQGHNKPLPGLTNEETAWANVLCSILRSRDFGGLAPAWRDVEAALVKAVDALATQAEARRAPELLELASAAQGHLFVATGCGVAKEERPG